MYLCIYVLCIYVSMYLCIHAFLFLCIYVCTYACMHPRMHVWMCGCVDVCNSCMCVSAYVMVCWNTTRHWTWSLCVCRAPPRLPDAMKLWYSERTHGFGEACTGNKMKRPLYDWVITGCTCCVLLALTPSRLLIWITFRFRCCLARTEEVIFS